MDVLFSKSAPSITKNKYTFVVSLRYSLGVQGVFIRSLSLANKKHAHWKSKNIKKTSPLKLSKTMVELPKDYLFNGLWTPRVHVFW